MLNKIITLTIVAALAALLMPSKVDAWGAAHVGYTHVGPGGVYHTGRTVAAGPGGVYAGGRTSARGAYGGAYGGAPRYHYSGTPSGGVSYGATHYGYIR